MFEALFKTQVSTTEAEVGAEMKITHSLDHPKLKDLRPSQQFKIVAQYPLHYTKEADGSVVVAGGESTTEDSDDDVKLSALTRVTETVHDTTQPGAASLIEEGTTRYTIGRRDSLN